MRLHSEYLKIIPITSLNPIHSHHRTSRWATSTIRHSSCYDRWKMLYFLYLSILAYLGLATALALPLNFPSLTTSGASVQLSNDITYPCQSIDHWFNHERIWIRASSTNGCMALETNVTTIYALNKLIKPDYVSHNYRNLVCSLNQEQCQWKYSPLDPITDNSLPVVNVSLLLDATIQRTSGYGESPCEILPQTIDSPNESDLDPDQETPATEQQTSNYEEN